MHNYNLGFISNENIYSVVKETVESFVREITLGQFNHNIVDPIKLTFDSKVYGKTIKEAIENECLRQVDKSNTNQIGYFHQKIFRYAGHGWCVPKKGFDVENRDLHIFAEIKNKHNTMNSSSSQKIYSKMQWKLLDDDEAVCYLVEVISKCSKDETWKTTLDGERKSHNKIRRISMDKFYAIVYNDPKAFYKLCVALPLIIEDVVKENSELALNNTVYTELTHSHSDLLTALYMLAFSTYEGFENFLNDNYAH